MEILNAFKTCYYDTLKDPELYNRIQHVKGALYRRSYSEAFSSRENLEAYIVRWSPSRALAYAAIFEKYEAIRNSLSSSPNVCCIGGGAGAEIAALSQFNVSSVTAIDMGDWESVTRRLSDHMGISDLHFYNGDALELMHQIDVSQFKLITCLFTTNELVAQSKQGYVRMLQRLAGCSSETILVVIESAGSYSQVQIGSKMFPVHYLLHYTLTKQSSNYWEVVDSTDSEWYRLPEELRSEYPWELQNMRYFLRIYRKK